MTYSLKNLKSSQNSSKKLLDEINKQKGFQKDERYWELTVDKGGNGFATIRFLQEPFVDGEDGVPYVMYWRHSFQGPGGWYMENSRTSLGRSVADPVAEYNRKLWNTNVEANRKIASTQKRQQKYVSNILVIKDVAKPENEGKVFLYSYGKEIFTMIQERLPELKRDDVTYDPDFLFFNPFNFWEGANFKLSARQKDSGFRSYDKSTFLLPGPVSEDENEIERIWKASYSLKEVVAPSNFKTYDELKDRLDTVLGFNSNTSSSVEGSEAAEVTKAVASSTELTDDDEELFRKLSTDDDESTSPF